MDIPKKVLELVERFENNLESYKKGQFKETQVRREFIDPFFEELGWDIANKQGYAEAYKEVVISNTKAMQSIDDTVRYHFNMPRRAPIMANNKLNSI